MDAYKATLTKWAADSFVKQDLLDTADRLIADCQLSAFEGQLSRSLRKPVEEHKASCLKYMKLYAAVQPDLVCTQLWEAAQAATA